MTDEEFKNIEARLTVVEESVLSQDAVIRVALTNEELQTLRARLRAVEDLERKTGAGLGVLYSGLQRQLTDISLRLEALTQSLKKLHPELYAQYEEFYSELKRTHEEGGQEDVFR